MRSTECRLEWNTFRFSVLDGSSFPFLRYLSSLRTCCVLISKGASEYLFNNERRKEHVLMRARMRKKPIRNSPRRTHSTLTMHMNAISLKLDFSLDIIEIKFQNRKFYALLLFKFPS